MAADLGSSRLVTASMEAIELLDELEEDRGLKLRHVVIVMEAETDEDEPRVVIITHRAGCDPVRAVGLLTEAAQSVI